MRDAPTYALAVQSGIVGDDPLGLASYNEQLYNSALPGFNNYVRYIRVYSAICWVTNLVEDAFANGIAKTDKEAGELFESALERIELILLWANKGRPGLAGSTRQFPDGDSTVQLRFDAFGTNQATLFEAVTYRPSLTAGLGFLEPRANQTFACLPQGEALAEAFDLGVRELPGYKWLKSLSDFTGTKRKVDGLSQGLDVSQPSLAERDAFQASFFPERLSSDAPHNARARHQTLLLMLRAVAAICSAKSKAGRRSGASVQEIRATMAHGVAFDGTPVLSSDVQTVHAWWAILQLRQLQRLCLEALYCVVERWIAGRETDGNERSLEQCVVELSVSGLSFLSAELRAQVGALDGFFRKVQGAHLNLFRSSALHDDEEASEFEGDVFLHMERLLQQSTLEIDESGCCEGVANAYRGLVFCAVETTNLALSPETRKRLEEDKDPCSLLGLLGAVKRFTERPVEDFLRYVIKDWVVLRHFTVVSNRSIAFDGKNRFRFVLGDYGLERFDKAARLPLPVMSPDKLQFAALLCEQCGLLDSKEGQYKLTARGRRLLKANPPDGAIGDRKTL